MTKNCNYSIRTLESDYYVETIAEALEFVAKHVLTNTVLTSHTVLGGKAVLVNGIWQSETDCPKSVRLYKAITSVQ